MRRSRNRCRFLLAATLCGLALVACTSWEETRRDLVDPLNQLLHRDYPKLLRERESERVGDLFVAELRAWAVRDAVEITAGFATIQRARCVIHAADPPDGQGAVRCDCVLRLDGIRDGVPSTWEQERVITARPEAGVWRIVAVEPAHTIEVKAATGFREAASSRGLVATSRSRGMLNRAGELQTYLGSSGVAIGDVDGDGRDDVLLVSGDQLRLFHNLGGQFVDESSRRGIVTPATGECRCAFFGDIDNDGDADLFVGMLDRDNLLFENEGGGHFREVPASASGLRSLGHTASACFGDFDRDGDLDLVVVNGNNYYVVDPEPPYAAKNAIPNQFFRNRGDGTFTEATDEVGMGDSGWGLACAVSDYDRDGDLDLFIANDLGVDVLYRNRGDGSFDDVTEAAGLAFHGSSMSADFGDVNGDGWADLYVSGMASNSRWILNQPGFPLPAPFPFNILFRGYILDMMWQMFHGNRLYLNSGDGSFEEVSERTRTYWLGWGWSAVFLDYDNDTHLDIYGVNGFWTGEQTADC